MSPPEFTLHRESSACSLHVHLFCSMGGEKCWDTVINILCNHAVPCMSYEHAEKKMNPYRTVCYANKSSCMHMHVDTMSHSTRRPVRSGNSARDVGTFLPVVQWAWWLMPSTKRSLNHMHSVLLYKRVGAGFVEPYNVWRESQKCHFRARVVIYHPSYLAPCSTWYLHTHAVLVYIVYLFQFWTRFTRLSRDCFLN